MQNNKPLTCNDKKLSSGICQEKNCKLKPDFNYENETKAIYCLKHKKENMVNIKSNPYLKICKFYF